MGLNGSKEKRYTKTTTAMRMLRWAADKTKNDRIKNEDIWREGNSEAW